MMNARVLELLKNPKNIQSEDLVLLKEEIQHHPYIQNIRALHLYGVHLYDQENYQKTLSSTAAYTTDKKILYQLINGKIQVQKKEIIEENIEKNSDILDQEEEASTTNEAPKSTPHDYEEATKCLLTPKHEVKHLIINGERNRILFEGEEHFLDENNNETIDLESTLESGIIVTLKPSENTNTTTEFEEIAENSPEEISEVLNPELIIEEENIESEQVSEQITDTSELSFHGTDSFLPEVKIESKSNIEAQEPEIQKPNINKHEDEMRRLIEEVERKMKVKKESEPAKKIIEEEEETSRDINFGETQSFLSVEEQKPAEKSLEKASETIQEEKIELKNSEKIIEEKKEIAREETQPEINSAWKPMNFETHLPDSLMNKSNEIPQIKPEASKWEESPKTEVFEEKPAENALKTQESEEISKIEKIETETIHQEKEELSPVMNVSFFGSDISSLNTSLTEETEFEITEGKTQQPEIDDSNVPGFINTWQNWLKIDRSEEMAKEKAETKNKAIESFIENNPKISQLKDEVNFVVKEKTDDISHLMTETLANLYIEQKLYTKAINAFQILANKHLDKKSYFEEKIQEIKDSRGRN